MIGLLIVLILVGVMLYLVGQIPMDAAVLAIIRVVVLLCLVLYVLSALGIVDVPLPKVR